MKNTLFMITLLLRTSGNTQNVNNKQQGKGHKKYTRTY